MAGALRRDPFSVTADPDAYVPRPAAETALRALEAALRAGRRSVALSGPPGIGKTMLLRVLERRLADVARAVYLPYAALDFEDLCTWVLGVLDLPLGGDPAAGLLATARAEQAHGRFLLVMMDDASALTPEAARRWVALSEQAAGALRLLAVPVDDGRAGRVLAALGEGLEIVRFSAPLEEDETAAFVRGRLGHAGAAPDVVARFDDSTLVRLHGAAAGNPRRLQRLATQALRRDAHPVLLADPDDPEAVSADASGSPGEEPHLEVDDTDALLPADRVDAGRHEYDTPLPVFSAAFARAEELAREGEGHGEGEGEAAAVSEAEPAAPEPAPLREAPKSREPAPLPPAPTPAPAAAASVPGPGSHEAAPRGEAPRPPASHLPVLLVPRRRSGTARLLLAAAGGTLLGFFLVWLFLREPEPMATPAPAPAARTEPAPDPDPARGTPDREPAAEEQDTAAEASAPSPEVLPEATTLAPAPAPPIAVHINAVPWARVFVDDREIGITPLADVPVEPGLRHFRAELPDGTVVEREVEVDETTRHLSFAPPAAPTGDTPR